MGVDTEQSSEEIALSRNEKPEAPEGTEWHRIDRAGTTTFDDYETRPYQECPHCEEHKYRLRWSYRGNFTRYWQKAYYECKNCEYSEEVHYKKGYVGIAKWLLGGSDDS